jgi:hypothetical protein
LPIHITRSVGTQKYDGGFIFILVGHPTHRDQVGQPGDKFFWLAGVDAAGGYGIDPNILSRPIGCQILGVITRFVR